MTSGVWSCRHDGRDGRLFLGGTVTVRMTERRPGEEKLLATPEPSTPQPWEVRVGVGLTAGLIGAVGYGILLQALGMIWVVGQLIGVPGPIAGWLVHLFVGTALGGVYAATFGPLPHNRLSGPVYGLVYGLIWLVLGVLILFPVMVNQPLFQFGQPELVALAGHLVYGLAVGLVYVAVTRQIPQTSTA